MLISPTAAAVVQEEDIAASKSNFKSSILANCSQKPWFVGREGFSFRQPGLCGESHRSDSGDLLSEAAQYVSKVLAAEVFATHGVSLKESQADFSFRQCCWHNTHEKPPAFQAGFLGAQTFGVEIFDVETTQKLSNMLIFHDLLNPDSYDRERDTKLVCQTSPWWNLLSREPLL